MLIKMKSKLEKNHMFNYNNDAIIAVGKEVN